MQKWDSIGGAIAKIFGFFATVHSSKVKKKKKKHFFYSAFTLLLIFFFFLFFHLCSSVSLIFSTLSFSCSFLFSKLSLLLLKFFTQILFFFFSNFLSFFSIFPLLCEGLFFCRVGVGVGMVGRRHCGHAMGMVSHWFRVMLWVWVCAVVFVGLAAGLRLWFVLGIFLEFGYGFVWVWCLIFGCCGLCSAWLWLVSSFFFSGFISSCKLLSLLCKLNAMESI